MWKNPKLNWFLEFPSKLVLSDNNLGGEFPSDLQIVLFGALIFVGIAY